METGFLDSSRMPMLPEANEAVASWANYYTELQQAILNHAERGKPWRPPVKPAECVGEDVTDFPPPPPPPDGYMDAGYFGQVRRMQRAKAQADAWVAASVSAPQLLEPYQPTMPPPEMPGSPPEEDHSLDDPPELPGLNALIARMGYAELQKAILDHVEKGKPWPPLEVAR